ncbi:MAG: hypothetical protein JSV91_14005 [Phycisphaerales bacterium]|nr:MAG: hypothetical protein JSV91_14005 [Phycisphaerales bacterium]
MKIGREPVYKVCACIAVFGVSLLVSTAPADPGISFSFASDTNPDEPTFMGQGFNIFDAGTVLVDFLVDDNLHEPGGVTEFAGSAFDFSSTIWGFESVDVGGYWVHMWFISGEFSFNGGDLLTTAFSATLVSSLSPDPNTIGPTLTLQGSEATDPYIEFLAGAELNDIGIYNPDLVAEEAFAFTLTEIRNLDGTGLPHIDPATGEFLEAWDAEGSYSAFATVPGPAALGVIGLGLATTRTRRRRI